MFTDLSKKKMKTAVIYSRTSSNGYQQNRQDTSRQVADLRAYADYAQMKVVKVYEEHISGASKQKPALVEAINYCKQEKVDMMLVSELSRVGRNAFEVLATVKELADNKINLFETYSVGDEIKVMVKKFTPKEHRIALSVKDIQA